VKLDFLMFFILAHLIGDFVLQTDKIARKKSTSINGLLIHCSIIFLTQIALLSIFGFNGIFAGAVGGIIHLIFDLLKNVIGKYVKKQIIYFIMDQGIHLAVIFGLTYIFAPAKVIYNSSIIYTQLLSGLIIITFAATVAAKILVRDLVPTVKNAVFFEKKERFYDALSAIFIACFWILPGFLGFLPAILAFYPYNILQQRKFNYNIATSLIKYSIYVLIGFLTILLTVKPLLLK
jgi:hypothetical protein